MAGSGQNVLLDVHGWENSTLGDPTVSRYFDNALGLNHVSNSGSDGYLIKWGMQNGINSTLVELPLPANPQDVINRNLSGKFISAVNNLLANTGVPASSTSAPEGWLDVVDGDHIAGWARDQDNLADSICVHIYIRNRSTGQVTRFAPVLANDYRGDIAPGSHGFNYAVDWRTIPPGDYQIETYAIGQNGNNPLLSGAPKYYTVNASNGCVDYVDSYAVDGSGTNVVITDHYYYNNDENHTLFKTNQNGSINSAYDRNGSYNYMMTYGNYGNGYSRNSYYKNVGDDCTSFASQCLSDANAGKLSYVGSIDKANLNYWFYNKFPVEFCSDTWGDAEKFREYWAGDGGASMHAYKYVQYLSVDVAIKHFSDIYNSLQVGDMFQVKYPNGRAHHSMIVQNKDPITKDIIYAQHEGDKVNLSLYNAMERWKTQIDYADNWVDFIIIKQ